MASLGHGSLRLLDIFKERRTMTSAVLYFHPIDGQVGTEPGLGVQNQKS
jgi:hypothetical protein